MEIIWEQALRFKENTPNNGSQTRKSMESHGQNNGNQWKSMYKQRQPRVDH
jgi:hypothetical protein